MEDTDNTSKTTHTTCCGTTVEGSGEAHQCPMAEKFGAALGSPGLKAGLFLPGILLVTIGILILIKPEVLVWLAGGISILFGIMFLIIAISLKRWASSFKH